jgi:2-dehydro-3-deoxygluconokinase
MIDVFTLGETMIRLSPPAPQRLEEGGQLAMNAGGTESNVAANLARLGKKTLWFSRLPDTPLGQYILMELRQHGVDTSTVQLIPNERMGLYFIEYGSAPRGIRILYDRANSAASHMTPADLPYEKLEQSRWLHLTGITPALSATCAETTRAALDHAQKHPIQISFDVNYRALLWSPEACAAVIEPFCQAANITFVALRDAITLFHTSENIHEALRDLQARWGGTVIITHGENGASAFDGQIILTAPAFPADIIDRIGAGDAFVSGVICRLLEDAPLEDALRFGTAMSALKLSITGDIARITRPEVEVLVNGQMASLKR